MQVTNPNPSLHRVSPCGLRISPEHHSPCDLETRNCCTNLRSSQTQQVVKGQKDDKIHARLHEILRADSLRDDDNSWRKTNVGRGSRRARRVGRGGGETVETAASRWKR